MEGVDNMSRGVRFLKCSCGAFSEIKEGQYGTWVIRVQCSNCSDGTPKAAGVAGTVVAICLCLFFDRNNSCQQDTEGLCLSLLIKLILVLSFVGHALLPKQEDQSKAMRLALNLFDFVYSVILLSVLVTRDIDCLTHGTLIGLLSFGLVIYAIAEGGKQMYLAACKRD